MKKETSELSLVLWAILLFAFVIFMGFRMSTIDISYDNYCLEKHGEGWFYESNEYYGRYCAQVDNETFEVLSREKMPSLEEAKDFCEVPKFFSFKQKERCNASELNLRKLKGGNK